MREDCLRHKVCMSLTLTTLFSVLSGIVEIDAYAPSTIPISGSYTITTSGVYALSQNITGSIGIEVSDVTLDLNSHTIVSSVTAISVREGVENVHVFNGIVDGASYGIAVQGSSSDPCSCISLSNVRINNCVERAIYCEYCNNSVAKSCELTSNGLGIDLLNCSGIVVDQCIAQDSAIAAFKMDGCSFVTFRSCKAIKNLSSQDVYGFWSINGDNNVFQACYAEDIESTGSSAYGIAIASDTSSLIHACVVNRIVAHNSAYGIETPQTKNYCFIFQNIVKGVVGCPGYGISGVYKSGSYNNVIIQNRAFACTANYSSTISNVSNTAYPARLDLNNVSYS